MTRRAGRVMLLSGWIAFAVLGSGASAPQQASQWRVAGLRERLSALTPANPGAYFDLAEEVAAEIRDPAGRRLAQELFILAFEAARAHSPTARARGVLGPSVCLALADLAADEQERRWLLVSARLLAEAAGTRDPELPESPQNAPGADALAAAIALLRAGESAQARDLLKRDDVKQLVESVVPILGAARRLIEDANLLGGCPACRNRRTGRGPGDSEQGPCHQCGGNPGAALNSAEFIASLRVEGMLVGAAPASWSADLLLNGGRSLDELGPDALAQRYGVNPMAFFWDARPGGPEWTGAWVEEKGSKAENRAPAGSGSGK